MLPTRIGISGGKASGGKDLESILYMYGRCISRLCSSSSIEVDMVSKREVAFSSVMVPVSRTKSPRGVS